MFFIMNDILFYGCFLFVPPPVGAGRGRPIALQAMTAQPPNISATTRYQNGTRMTGANNASRLSEGVHSIQSFNAPNNPLSDSDALTHRIIQSKNAVVFNTTETRSGKCASKLYLQQQSDKIADPLNQGLHGGIIDSLPNEMDPPAYGTDSKLEEIVITNKLNLELGIAKSEDDLVNRRSTIASTADTPIDGCSQCDHSSPPFMDDTPVDQMYSPLILDNNLSSQHSFPLLNDDKLLDITTDMECR